jgi:pimeloyl-ACP methyl ester carboxylesterase
MRSIFNSFSALLCTRRKGLILALAWASAIPVSNAARAQTVALSFSGTMGDPNNPQYSIDTLGIFGTPGANLAGAPFVAKILYIPADFTAYDPPYDYISDISGALSFTLTIDGVTKTSICSGHSSLQFNQYGQLNPNEQFLCQNLMGMQIYGGPQVPQFLVPIVPYPGSNPYFTVYSGQQSEILGSTAGALTLINPFQLGVKDLRNFDLPMLLQNITEPNSATALVADGTSAAIALFQVNSMAPVTFTTNNGTTLRQYDPHFLTYQPSPGNSTLTVTPIQIGTLIYAVALLQSPPAAVTPNYTTPIVITAQQQGGELQEASLPLAPPPVVLVHGLWGDQKSLGSLQTYLNAQFPWNTYSNLVNTLCYSKYTKFDAETDPLSNGQLCEVTSEAALGKTITNALVALNSQGVVVGKVDVAAHSMGGLAVRNYASKSAYRSDQNRGEGQFHTIVTLDTPEIGSELASFLINNQNKHRQRGYDTVWTNFCGQGVTGPIGQCFDRLGLPVSATGLPLKDGAVYSLMPNSPSLLNPKLSPPVIPNSLWLAVAADAPSNSATEDLLNDLMTELTAKGGTPPTVSSVLHTTAHDAIVTVQSQANGNPSSQYTFPQFSHSSFSSNQVIEYLINHFGWNDNSVVNDPTGSVNKLVGCWLQTIGSSICPPAEAHDTVPAAPSASEEHPERLYPIEVTISQTAELGVPTEVGLHMKDFRLAKRILIAQREVDGYNHGSLDQVKINRVADGVMYVSVMPTVIGKSIFQVNAESESGSDVGTGSAKLVVKMPSSSPTSFTVSEFRRLIVDLDDGDRSVILMPIATFPNLDGKFVISPSYLTFDIANGGDPSVLSISKNGRILGTKEGMVVLEAHLGSATDRVEVVVQHRPPNSFARPVPAP